MEDDKTNEREVGRAVVEAELERVEKSLAATEAALEAEKAKRVEANAGWLACQAQLAAEADVSEDELAGVRRELVVTHGERDRARAQLAEARAEIADLKQKLGSLCGISDWKIRAEKAESLLADAMMVLEAMGIEFSECLTDGEVASFKDQPRPGLYCGKPGIVGDPAAISAWKRVKVKP